MANDKLPFSVTTLLETGNPLTAENIKNQFERQRIDENLYHKVMYYIELIEQEELEINGTNPELANCKGLLVFVLGKIPEHLKRKW